MTLRQDRYTKATRPDLPRPTPDCCLQLPHLTTLRQDNASGRTNFNLPLCWLQGRTGTVTRDGSARRLLQVDNCQGRPALGAIPSCAYTRTLAVNPAVCVRGGPSGLSCVAPAACSVLDSDQLVTKFACEQLGPQLANVCEYKPINGAIPASCSKGTSLAAGACSFTQLAMASLPNISNR